MLRVYHLLIGSALVALIPMGVNFVRSHFYHQNNLPSKSHKKNIVNNYTPNQSNIWKSILGKTDGPKGWQVKECDRNASLLCVSANGKNLGKVAIEIYPLGQRSDFQKMLAKVGISPSNPWDSQNPQYQTQMLKALRNWVDAEYAILSQQYQQSDGDASQGNLPNSDQIIFAAQPPEVVRLGKLQGIHYGFAGLRQAGGVVEKHIQYVTFDGKAMYIIKTAFAPDAIPGKFEKLEHLAVFEPYLSTIVKNLQLPRVC